MNGHTAAIIAVWVACGIVLLAIVVVIVLLLQRRRLSSRRTTKFYPGYTYTTSLELRSSPSPGAYASPLTVELEILSLTTAPGTQILVHVIPTASVSSAHSTVLGNDGFYSSSFLLYSSPLCFSESGSYCIQAHTFNADTKVVGAVHQFIFSLAPRAPDVTSAAPVAAVGRSTEVDIALPSRPPAVLPDTLPLVPTTHRIAPRSLPPQIMPSTGEVTTATPIVMTPHPHSQTADQIRYSVDGSYPSILYTSPIFLSVPPSQLSSSSSSPYVTIKAIAVPAASTPAPAGDMTGPSSPISQVVLKVRSAGCSYLDPTVPAPSMRLRAVDAKLYFDESQNPSGTRTCYQLVSVNEARRKAKYSRKHSTLYTGVPISISEDVAAIYAWTVDEAHFMRSSGQDDLDSVTGSVDGGATRLRSVAAVYDCARASTEIVKASRSRIQDRATSLLPPPVPCISCSEMEVEFEEPPAHSVIAYTLNGREPLLNDVNPPACAALLDGTRHDADSRGLGTFLYSPSQRIHLTLLESEGAQITARIFIPINDGGVQLSEDLHGGVHASVAAGGGTGKLTGYRLGKLFHRSFFFHDAQWSCEKP